ncbi:MAG: sensor histidine kinase [Prevotella sp.]|nr:sensor histidine kinase [Prevotella sp.]
MDNIVRHIRQSLSWKLSLGILLMAIPIFVLSIGFLFIHSRDKVKKEATEHAASVVNTTMQHITRFMDIVETATDVNDWEVTAHLDPDSILAISRGIVVLNGHIDGCSISTEPNIFPKYGRNFSAYTVREADTITTVIEEPYEYFEKVWYKTPHLQGKPCWVVYYDESDSLALTLDGMIASYSKPLYNENKHFVGVISTDLSLIRLSKVITSETPYEGSYFIMTGSEGRYLLHPDSTQLFTKTIYADANPRENTDIFALGHEMTTGKTGSMSVKINGEQCLVSYQTVPGTNWSLALICPERSILRNYNRLNYIIAPLFIIGFILVLLFSSITVAQAIHPLYKLTGNLQRITSGHYDEQIPRSPRYDVVSRLQNSFATMQESLNDHVNEIRQMNEEALRRNEELVHTSELAKASNQQKTLFIQNVSHQIRTPLNIIMGFAQVLKESKGLMPDEEARSVTDMMRHNAMLLNRMVLMLSDCSARGVTLELYASKEEEVSCVEVAQESIDQVRGNYPNFDFRLTVDLPDDFYITTNRHYLLISVRELLNNAANYSTGGYAWLRVTEYQSKIRFIVQDEGPGIPKEESDRMFEMFTKVNDLSEGLGLGLALTKRHIQNLGGIVFLDESYTEGCRMIIELPKVS